MRIACTAKRSSQSILKETSPQYSLEELILKLKLQYFGHLMQRTDSLEITLMLGKIEGRRKGRQKMRWLNHQLYGHEFEQALGVGDGQGRLPYCSPVQFSCSVMSNSLHPHGPTRQTSLSISNSQSLLKFMSIESEMPSNLFILYCPLLLLSSIFPSIRVFSN